MVVSVGFSELCVCNFFEVNSLLLIAVCIFYFYAVFILLAELIDDDRIAMFSGN